MEILNDWLGKWNNILHVMELIASGFVAIGLFWAIKQLRFNAWVKAQDIFVNSEFNASRRKLFSYLAPRKVTHDPENKDDFIRVCQQMDLLCRLSPFFGRHKLMKNWDDPIGKAWFIAQEWVKQERIITNWKKKWRGFEKTGEKSLNRLKLRGSKPKFRVDKIPPK